MVKVLVCALTSNKLNLLHRCIKSIDNQYPVKFEYDCKIVVNTLNDEYYNHIKNYYGENEKWDIIRTESNGRPGKGHNSVLWEVFKNRPEYNYLIMIDGDDLFYPCAFQILERSFDEEPDILHLMLNDYISIIDKPKLRSVKLKGNYKLYGSFNEERNWWKSIPVKNPYKNPIQHCKTPTRIVLASRNIFKTTIPIKYSENMKLYDDYMCFLGIYEAHLREELNIFAISNSYIYHYNATNDDSVSVKFNDPKYENEIFQKESEKFEKASQTWDLANLHFLALGNHETFTTRDKINMSYEVINDIMKEKWISINKYLGEKNYEKLRDQLRFVSQSGIDDNYFVNFNLGVCYYKEKKYSNAIYYLEKASYLKPSFEVFHYLFKISTEVGSIERTKYYCEILTNFKDQQDIFIKTRMNIDKSLSYKEKKCGNFTVKRLINKIYTKNIKPKIVYYTGYSDTFNGKNYKNKPVWGSEIAAIKLCESFAKLGYEPHIFCKCDEEIEHNGVFYHKDIKFQNFQYNNYIDYLIVSRYLHFFIEHPLDVGKIIFLMHDARGHNHWLSTQFTGYGNPLYNNLLDKIDNIVCVSNWQVDNFHKFTKFDKKYFTVISNGINSHMFDNSKKLLNKKQNNRIIYCSDPDRGLKHLINHFDSICKEFPDAQLDIYFSRIPKELEKLIENLDYINFRGKLPNDELIEELKKSDYWIYPNFSSHETFCIAALEAMGSGCIPITREFSGLIETIGDVGKLIEREHTPQKFFEETINFMKEMNTNINKKHEMRLKCINRVLFNYDWDKVAEQWKEKILN
jgi:glycosyltransferase involved in cell wall biosynthesis